MHGNRSDAMRLVTNPIGWLRDKLFADGLEYFANRFYGLYPATVVDNADPENRGRIRATVAAIGVDKPEMVGPGFWALPCMNGLGVGEDGQATGMFHPPDVGTEVWVQFQYGDPAFPVYMGGYITKKTSDTFDAEGALKKGIRTKTGHFIRMSDDPADLHLMIAKGDGAGGPSPAFLTMDKDGSTLLTNEKGSMLFMSALVPETSLMTANDAGEVTALLMLGDDKITLATKSGGALGIDGKNVTVTGDNMVTNLSGDFAADSGSVHLGKGAAEPAVLGNALMAWAIQHGALGHLGPGPVPGAPCTPGAGPPLVLNAQLSSKVYVS